MVKVLKLISVMCLFFAIVLYSNGVFASGVEVNEEQAKVVAENFIWQTQHVEEWSESDIVLVRKLYDLDDSVLGYYFELFVNDKYVGYIVVSATKEREPVLQYGEGIFLEEEPASGERIYYLGAFANKYAKNAIQLKGKVEEDKASYIQELERTITSMHPADKKEDFQTALKELNELKNAELTSVRKSPGEFEREWNQLLQPSKSNDLKNNITSTSKLLNVTRVWQRTSGVSMPDQACGPTVGVMINNFYKRVGYWVKDSNDYGGNAKFINRMINEMGTNLIGTTAANFRDGVRRQLNVNHGTCCSPFRAWILSANGYYESYKTSLVSNRPVALRFDNLTKGDYRYKWHFVAGVGFNGSYAVVMDPDGGQYNTGTHSFSWSANQKVMTMIITSPN